MEYWKQELYHHGILGMKWGNRNGPPYPLSRDRNGHTAEEIKSGWQKSKLGTRNTAMYDRNEAEAERRRYWQKKGYSTPPAKKNIKKGSKTSSNTQTYKKTYLDSIKRIASSNKVGKAGVQPVKLSDEQKKKLKVAAAITAASLITAAGIYAYKKYGEDYFDYTIKAGDTIQTVTEHGNRLEIGQAFYTAFKDSDKTKYVANWGEKLNEYGFGTGEFKKKVEATLAKDIKVANLKTAKQVFNDLMESNSEFRSYALGPGGKMIENGDLVLFNSSFDKFSTLALLNNDPSSAYYEKAQQMQKVFFDALKEKGYGGLIDVNDRKNSGYDTLATIIFDKTGLMDKKVTDLGSFDIEVAKRELDKIVMKEALVETIMAPENVAMGGASIGMLIANSAINDGDKREGDKVKKG